MFRQLNKFKLIFTLMSEINKSMSDKTNLIKLRISTRAHVKRREIWQKPLRVLFHDVRLNFDLTNQMASYAVVSSSELKIHGSFSEHILSSVRPSVRKPFNSPEPKTQVITWGQNFTLKLNIKSFKFVSNIKDEASPLWDYLHHITCIEKS